MRIVKSVGTHSRTDQNELSFQEKSCRAVIGAKISLKPIEGLSTSLGILQSREGILRRTARMDVREQESVK